MRAVLFDAMGTLLTLDDPAPALAAALRRRHGIAVSDGQAGAALAAEIAYYRAHHDEGRDAPSLHALRLRCTAALRAALPHPVRGGGPPAGALSAEELLPTLLEALRFRAFADAAPALDALRGLGLRLAVVSNWDVSLPQALAAVGLLARLDAVVASAQVGAAKPAPAIFAAALERLGVSAGEAVHVGDSLEHDVAGARASGVRPILLRRAGAGERAGAVAQIDTLAALAPLIGRRA